MKKLLKISIGAAVFCCVASFVSTASADQVVTTPNGTWDAYPGQSVSYSGAIQQPINTDGSSSFRANGHAVVPIKFALSQGSGVFVFESIGHPSPTDYAYSYLNFVPNTAVTFNDITELSAVYDFTTGDCHVGSLRWTLYLDDHGVTRNLDIHYQPGENGLNDQWCAAGTSGANMVMRNDTNVVINKFTYVASPYTFQSSYNTTYADALSQLGGLRVLGMNLIVDSGLEGNQVVDLTSATVGTAAFTDTFEPQPASSPTPVCPTAEATIGITKRSTSPSGDVQEPQTIQPADHDMISRIVDCNYMYNLATSSLGGPGTYDVTATIDGPPFPVATFSLK